MSFPIIDDAREIKLLVWADPDQPCYQVGAAGVTSIRPYTEKGQVQEVPWFVVYMGDQIISRVNAAAIAEVCYLYPAEVAKTAIAKAKEADE